MNRREGDGDGASDGLTRGSGKGRGLSRLDWIVRVTSVVAIQGERGFWAC